jgi:hypothetical protein
MTEPRFKIGDRIAAAVLTYKRAALRVGKVEKIHPPTRSIPQERYTIRDEHGNPHIVSSARAVQVEADEHHTMKDLYEYRLLYNAHAVRDWIAKGYPVVKSWKHHDGEECFGGGWFIVTAELPSGQVSNHYKKLHWNLFDVPAVQFAPEWDGHTPAVAAARLLDAL